MLWYFAPACMRILDASGLRQKGLGQKPDSACGAGSLHLHIANATKPKIERRQPNNIVFFPVPDWIPDQKL
jgi:hypothetical protein